MTVLRFITPAGRLPRPAAADIEIQRLPLGMAADWQYTVAAHCQRLRTPSAAVFSFLKATGLHARCVLLAGEPGCPLVFRFIGEPSIRFFGASWARRQLGRPEHEDPHGTIAATIGAEYREAMEAGPVLNRLRIAGLSAVPLVYTHMVFGWRLDTGHRAVLSCLDAPSLN